MVRCWIAGATGYVGREVVRALTERGARVRAIAHVRPDSSRLDEWRGRFGALGAEVDATPWQAEPLADAMRRTAVTHVFCLIGTTRSRARRDGVSGDRYQAIDAGLTRILVDAAVGSGAAPRFVYLSSIGADPAARSAYLRARGDAEAAVAGCGLSHILVRPALITGSDRDETRAGERIGALLGDGALAAMSWFGAGALRERYRSRTGSEIARGIVALGLGEAEGVVDGGQLARGAAAV